MEVINIFLNGFPTDKKNRFEDDTTKNYKDISHKDIIFGGGEVHIKFPELEESKGGEIVRIFALANNSDDIMRILLTNNALKQKQYKNNIIFLPYVPYARQDRVMVDGEPLSIEVFADLINYCEFSKVFMFDIHSDVAPSLIKNRKLITNKDFVLKALIDIVEGNDVNKIGKGIEILGDKLQGSPIFVIPDSGAFKKIFKLADGLNYKGELILCNKARNLNDGKIMAYTVDKDNLGGSSVVIIDDICSRGGTFIGLAEELKKRKAGKIYLIVSHYEGIGDVDKLKFSGIERIYTTPSIGKLNDTDFIKVIPFSEIINKSEFI
jgi:ribose-phosphate pyrophosphokinase